MIVDPAPHSSLVNDQGPSADEQRHDCKCREKSVRPALDLPTNGGHGVKGVYSPLEVHADCWDNAPMESFFASLKKELVHDADFATRAEACAAIFEYIEVFYNGQRRHSSLGYVSPAEYEQSV